MNLGAPSELMTDAELMAMLRCSRGTFFALKKAGRLNVFAVPRPLTRARWSRAKVEQYARDESLVKFGRGSRG